MIWRGSGIALLGTLLCIGCGEDGPCQLELPGTVCAVAGTGDLGFNRDGNKPEDTDFFLVSQACRGPDGLLYFADFNNWRIRRLEDDGRIYTIAGNGVHGAGVAGIVASESPMDNPFGIDFLPDGRLVTVSFEDPRVLMIDEDGVLQILAGTGEQGLIGDEGDGGDPTLAQFRVLEGVLVGPDGSIYLSDSGAQRIRVIRDGIVETIVGSGDPGFSGDGGPATSASLSKPTAMALDAQGRLYFADSLNHAIRRVDGDGIIETVAGTGERGRSGDGGPATEAKLNEPFGVAVDNDGSVYIADRSNFRIRRVGPDGLIDTVAGTDEGYSGDGGPASAAQFGFLARLTFDGRSLLIADQSNGVVRRLFLEAEQ